MKSWWGLRRTSGNGRARGGAAARINRTLAIACLALRSWAAAPAADRPLPWVRVSNRDPRYLELDDGRPFIPIGLNLVHPGSPPGRERETMERWVDALATNGGNLIRIWLSQRWWNPESEPGRFDEEAARRLNDLLDHCGRRDVRVKITLDHFREIDPALSRQSWALRDAYHVSKGGPLRSMDDMWTSPAGRDLFVRRLAWLSERFSGRPEVFGWELWNEINAARGHPTNQIRWTAEMLAELRRRFPRQLAMQSLGSFDRDAARPLYRAYSFLPDNMLAQVHRYLDLGASLPVCRGPMDVLAADAVSELVAFGASKPILLAEGGAVEPNHSGPFRLYERDRDGVLLHDVLFAPFFAGAAGSGQCWHWNDYVDRNGLWWQFGRFAHAVAGLDPPAEGFVGIAITSRPPVRVWALRGRHTAIAWCRDARADWTAELQRGDAPTLIEGASLPLGEFVGSSAVRKVTAYDPWRNADCPVPAAGDRLPLPAFRRSLIVRAELQPSPGASSANGSPR